MSPSSPSEPQAAAAAVTSGERRECPGHPRALWADGSRRRGNRGGRGRSCDLDADGRECAQMEASVAALFAKSHGIMVNSGSSANYLAIELLGLPAGAEVITPALTFATTVAPLVKSGLVPVFVDVEPDTFNIDVEQVEAMIGPKTRAMMIPSLIGNLPDWDRLAEIAAAHDLLVIEDSADTLGATLRGTQHRHSLAHQYDQLLRLARHQLLPATAACSASIATTGPTKRGCCAAGDAARRCSSIPKNPEKRFDVDARTAFRYDAKFVFERIGYNSEPSEIGAAFGLVQLGPLAVEHRRASRATSTRTSNSSRIISNGSCCRANARKAGRAGWRFP